MVTVVYNRTSVDSKFLRKPITSRTHSVSRLLQVNRLNTAKVGVILTITRSAVSFFLVTRTWCFKIAFIIETVPCKLENDRPVPSSGPFHRPTLSRSARNAHGEIDIWLLSCIVNSFPRCPFPAKILTRAATVLFEYETLETLWRNIVKFLPCIGHQKKAGIVSSNERKASGNFTGGSWAPKNRRNRSHTEARNYILTARNEIIASSCRDFERKTHETR